MLRFKRDPIPDGQATRILADIRSLLYIIATESSNRLRAFEEERMEEVEDADA